MKTKTILASAVAMLLASCASQTPDPHAGHNMEEMSDMPGMTTSNGIKAYTSDRCVVTGNKLGSMGEPITMVHNGQEVKFCCKGCIGKFKANPDKYLAKL
jgi:hypothetical protein